MLQRHDNFLNIWLGNHARTELISILLLGLVCGCTPHLHRGACVHCASSVPPAPTGAYVHSWQSAQSYRESRPGYVIYEEDFETNSPVLSDVAREHLCHSINQFKVLGPIIIERTDAPDIDMARFDNIRLVVASSDEELANQIVVQPVPDDWTGSHQIENAWNYRNAWGASGSNP